MKKILILYTSVGLGHKSIAENIGFHLTAAGHEVKLADIGKVQNGKFEKIVVALHQFINRRLPFIWGWLYNWGHYIILPFRVFIAGFNYKLTKNFVDQFHPDLIITTQTTASAVVAYLKKKGLYKNYFAVAFSDYHLHPYYLYNQADFYLVNTSEQAQEMLDFGISKEKIFVCGITLKPKIEVNVSLVKLRLGIREGERVILVGTGSLGVGFKEKDLKELSKLKNSKIIFVCGLNLELFGKIKSLEYPNVIPLNFYEPMDELYAAANIFIGKPGGLSVAESLRWNLPLLVSFTLPGQEKRNLAYLLNKQLVMPRPESLNTAVEFELQTGNFKKQLMVNGYVNEVTNQSDIVAKAVEKVLLHGV